ncbi:MAG TPA: glycosyltransferase family 2 protein [Acetobacteraceae bacterium]|nr:glycosyltransferase family 2 protein [Acetobacteraceae bacterium]
MSGERRVSVVIPALEEGQTIGAVVAELPRHVAREIIVADGGSRDQTVARAQAAGARVVMAGRGYGRACAAGVAAADAGADVIAFLDGDGADRGDLLGTLVAPILAGTHDFVLASRTRGKREPGSMLWHQVLAGRLIGLVIGRRYGVRYSDMCAYRAIRRAALAGLGMEEMGYGWNVEMQIRAAAAGLRILEIPVPYRRRGGGRSKVAGSLGGTLRASARILSVAWRLAGPGGIPPARR